MKTLERLYRFLGNQSIEKRSRIMDAEVPELVESSNDQSSSAQKMS